MYSTSIKRKKKFENPKVEECGIWLDTRELKRRKKEPCSISKLLNPLSRRNYNIEVALNFTQTRAAQRCVKQTTVSSFFLPKSEGKLAKPPQTSTLRAVGAASPDSGKSVIEGETYASQPERIIDNNFCRDNFGCSAPTNQQERLPTILRAERSNSEEREPLRGTTHSNTTLSPNKQSCRALEQRQHFCLKGGASVDIVSQEPVSSHGSAGEVSASSDALSVPPDDLTRLDFTQDSQGNRVISHRKATRSPAVNCPSDRGTPVVGGKSDDWPPAKSAILCTQSFEAGLFGPLTSTQRTANREKGLLKRKAVAHSPKKVNSAQDKGLFPENKENIFGQLMYPNSASLKRPLVSHGTTPLLHRRNSLHDAESLAFKWPKTPRSDQSTLSLLFSQDSQGNRVISHRCPDNRCGVAFPDSLKLPLDHCTNSFSGGKGCSVPPIVKLPYLPFVVEPKYDDTFCPQADLLFTQDSEGNAVIRHS
ncbi:uncharacterized protein LOC121272326 [Carcharodon carcharias]|uniref:uncharacterized protein LOC121272326 n=1 Tax=Carcharodon carcharias TaxID=13397 RepID=UPI001B7F1F2A|nr:uncharacterized protein LOC121272326 [Carcharodon carcharias]XP_041034876.1 uncharacterized protein LOC121272326 [Carcharodon carcharias]XP_041034877.1 uncharacterized protein LOC121272326 [Carcharodon carcharias]